MTRRQICEDFLKNHSKNKLKESAKPLKEDWDEEWDEEDWDYFEIDDWRDERRGEVIDWEGAIYIAFPRLDYATKKRIVKWYIGDEYPDDVDSLYKLVEFVKKDLPITLIEIHPDETEIIKEVLERYPNIYAADILKDILEDDDLEESANKKAIKEDAWDDIADIERGGFDEFRDDEYENLDRANYVRNAAKAAEMSDIEYVEMEDLFNQDPKLEYIESGNFSEFLVDDEGNPGLEDAKVIFDNLYSGNYKGMYGADCTGDAEACLIDVIEVYNQSAGDAQVPLKGARMLTEYEARLQYLAQYKDNPKCVRCKQYFNALATYARQINEIADEYNLPKYKITIPGED